MEFPWGIRKLFYSPKGDPIKNSSDATVIILPFKTEKAKRYVKCKISYSQKKMANLAFLLPVNE